MADKTIGDLTRATAFSQSDLLVMEQNGQAKSVTGQVLMKDLAKMLDGHGGIKDIQKVKSVGYVDTYEITTADGTTYRYDVTNGKTPSISVKNIQTTDGRNGAQIEINNADGVTPDSVVEVYDGERGPSGTPRNWLDNSDFHFAVNQRGEKNYVVDGDAPVDAIDRWTLMSYGSEMSVDAYQAVICRGMFLQNLSKEAESGMAGKTVTVVVEDDYNRVWVASGSFSNGFSAAPNGLTISVSPTALILTTDNISLTRPRIGLYEGEYTAETLPKYQYKGYAAELMECRRYYINPDYIDANVSWLTEGSDASCVASGSVEKISLALGIPKPPMAMPPLILHGNADNTYTEEYLNESIYGDEALAAIRSGRQILVRTPNSNGDDYAASYSPIYFYQLPNRDNNYLYLHYLRDEKQDLSSLLSQPAGTVVMPVYGQLKMLLSKTYNESPLEPTAQGE